jgi:hypothetical protein
MIFSVFGFAQNKTIRIEAKDEPLTAVLLHLRNQYDFQFSYSENQLKPYKVTVSKSFDSKEAAINYLLKDLPFHFTVRGEVFIIIPDRKKKKDEHGKAMTQITGQIVEAGSYEPLPFSSIVINNHPVIADVAGNFNFTSQADSSFRVRISHLGYYIYDTLLYAGTDRQFELKPSVSKLPEVFVQSNTIEKATMVGERAGKISINNNIARFLPGQGDNSVFNMSRLMPGIQAAGEQSNDLLIWGSYEGQSLITFDEFTLFGLKNYSDNISVVNPFLVKNIEILKGGFDAKYGNRIGGIVNITGKNGNLQKPVFSVNINTNTVNGMLEIPLFKKSSLLMAYRQTYYNLYDSGDFSIFVPTRPQPKGNSDIGSSIKNTNFNFNVYPENYQFRDLNLKYTYNFDNGDKFYVSMYGGGDDFKLATDATLTKERIIMHNKPDITLLTLNLTDNEKNTQRGISAFYNRTWNSQLVTKFVLTHSDFSKQTSEDLQSSDKNNNNIINEDRTNTGNKAFENSFRIENILRLNEGHELEFGGGFYANEAEIENKINLRDTLSIDTLNRFQSNRAFAYIQDNLPIGKRLVLHTGARFIATTNHPKFYFEPRISASYQLNGQFKLNATFGQYHQFMYKVANVDKDQNYTYLWVTNNDHIPVQSATHWAGGINYFKKGLTFNVEAYYRMTHDITERVFERRTISRIKVDDYFPYYGNAKAYGLDFYARQNFGKHSVWASYTLSKTLESLAPENRQLPPYSYAPQHQLHELKLASIFNVGKFYFSGDYVYGSGMQILREVYKDDTSNVAYNRVDVAVTYRFTPKWVTGEVGFSVINLFDTQNLKYANLKTIHLTPELGDIRVYSNSVPFTPVIFLKLVF